MAGPFESPRVSGVRPRRPASGAGTDDRTGAPPARIGDDLLAVQSGAHREAMIAAPSPTLPVTVASTPFVIAHLSDLHCGSPYFVASLLDRAIGEINQLEPDVVVCSGDLTTFGYEQEYT